MITKDMVDAIMPENEEKMIFKAVAEESFALRYMRRLRDMTAKQLKLNIMDSLPTAYFVNGTGEHKDYYDPEFKQTTTVSWKNKYLYPEEIAVIVPVEESTIADAGYPLWDQIRPAIIEAIKVRIDEAVFFANSPFSWPAPIITAATAAGNVVAAGTEIDFADDVSLLMSAVEEDGYEVTGFISDVTMKHKLRTMRDSNGQPLLMRSMGQGTPDLLHGVDIGYMKNGVYNNAAAVMIAGDFKQAMYAWRQGITFKVFTEGVIQDPDTGAILLNLMQQDSVALRVVCRLGWQIPNPVNRMQSVEANRYPFAIMTP